MLVFCDSQDHYVTADLMRKYTSRTGTSHAIAATSPTPPYGTNRLAISAADTLYKLNPNGSQAGGEAHIWLRRATIDGDFVVVMDGATVHLTFNLNGSGNVRVYRGTSGAGTLLGTSTAALSINTWYHLRLTWTINDTTGAVAVYVGTATVASTDTDWVNLTAQDTRNGGNSTWDTFGLTPTTNTAYYKGIVLLDSDTSDTTNPTTAIPEVTAVGCKVASLGNGANADFTPYAGSDHGAMVDDTAPDDDTSYNVAAAVNDVDTYGFPVIGITNTIYGVQVVNCVSEDDDLNRQMAAVVRSSGTNYPGANQVADSTGYKFHHEMWAQNPATGLIWTPAGVDAAEFGLEYSV